MGLLRPITLGLLVLGVVAYSQGDTTSSESSSTSDILEHSTTDVSTEFDQVTEENLSWNERQMKSLINCTEKSSKPRIDQRRKYHVLYNYVPMSRKVRCWETLTYATNADFTFLDNLEPLLERWNAPISVALYAPGTDFQSTLDSIKYLRSCASPLVSELVTFHLYYSDQHVPEEIPPSADILSATYNCSLAAPWTRISRNETYKNKNGLIYPINVGRNVAKETALTHYLIVADIELYPSLNLARDFLDMLKNYYDWFQKRPETGSNVYVLPVFEITEDSQVPSNKPQLVEMFKNHTAFFFHEKICRECHVGRKFENWIQGSGSDSVGVIHEGSRKRSIWEPVYIGTDKDPIYDERLSWDGQKDKRIQGWLLCIQNYKFSLLDNAFLVHRPGIKVFKSDPRRVALISETNELIENVIIPEYQRERSLHWWDHQCVV